MEILLVRFTRAQRAWIRKQVRDRKAKSEAEAVRKCIDWTMNKEAVYLKAFPQL